ncbi:MAG: hypothetical protein EXS28_09280 [Pedosphaera sp.]|nr:hypothetical protein [Pedosphaera sp.]
MKTIPALFASLWLSFAVVLPSDAAESSLYSTTEKSAERVWLGVGLGEVAPLARTQLGLLEGVGLAVE